MRKIKTYYESLGFWSRRFILFALSSTLGVLITPFARGDSTVSAPTNLLTSTSAVTNLFCVTLDWMFWLLIVLSIAMALVAAFMYATSNGDAEKVGKATKTLTYVAIAIAVAIIAKGFPLIIGSFLSPGSNLNACSGNGGSNLDD